MKNGFTLVELLAVIVLLAVISAIAIPIVSNSINSAKEKTSEAEAEMILKGITDYCNNEDIKVRTGEIKKSDRICSTNLELFNIKKMVKNIKEGTNITNASYSDGKVGSLTVTSNGIEFRLDSNGNMVRTN